MEVVGSTSGRSSSTASTTSVVFHPLGREQIRAIADIQIGYPAQRLAEREIGLELTDAALDRSARPVSTRCTVPGR